MGGYLQKCQLALAHTALGTASLMNVASVHVDPMAIS